MSNWGVAAWYLVRDVECLTQTRKRLILLAFVSYEAVRLWWRGGSNGVVDFEKTPCICSIPTLASNLMCLGTRRLEIRESKSSPDSSPVSLLVEKSLNAHS